MAAKTGTYYRPELDVLRFVAFLGVYLHHSRWANPAPRTMHLIYSLSTGLQLFFFLSAFLITELLLREEEKTGTVHIQAFFLRRVLRIWPLYLFAVLACYIPTFFGYELFPRGALLPWLLLAGNWWTYMHNFSGSFAGPLWSISVEEQFYLVWPFLARAGVRRVLRPVAVALLFIGAGALIYAGSMSQPEHKFLTNSLVEFQFFGSGALVAFALHNLTYAPSRPARVSLLLASISAFLVQTYVVAAISPLAAAPVLMLCGFFLIHVQTVCALLAIYGMTLPGWARPLVYLGRISYGLYVYHLVSISIVKRLLKPLHLPANTPWAAVQMLLGLVVTACIASISYRCMEMPFLRLKRRFTFVHSRDA